MPFAMTVVLSPISNNWYLMDELPQFNTKIIMNMYLLISFNERLFL